MVYSTEVWGSEQPYNPIKSHKDFFHRRMARGGHKLPKVSPGPAMLYRSMRATPERMACSHGGRPAAVFYPLCFSVKTHLQPQCVLLIYSSGFADKGRGRLSQMHLACLLSRLCASVARAAFFRVAVLRSCGLRSPPG
jgi:hypothetical protein